MTSKAARFITQLEAGIAQRDARIVELEAIVPIESNLRAKAERVAAELDRELAALKAQKPSAGVACALMSALEGIVHDQRVPNEVSQECAAVLIEARRLKPNPAGSGVGLPERELFEEWADDQGFCLDCKFFEEGNNFESADTRMAFDIWMARASLNPCRAQAVPDDLRAAAENCSFVMRYIGSMEPDEIYGDNVELRFEDEDGRDTGADASIVEYAEKVADLLDAMLAAAPSAKKESE